MAAGSRGVILVAAATLVLASVLLASIDENTSSILIFTTIFSSAIIILYWKLFNSESKQVKDVSSTPVKIKNNSEKAKFNTITNVKSEVPDPLEQDIDIPLM